MWTTTRLITERPPVSVYDLETRREYTGRLWVHQDKALAQIVYFRWPHTRRVIWVSWEQVAHALNTATPLTA